MRFKKLSVLFLFFIAVTGNLYSQRFDRKIKWQQPSELKQNNEVIFKIINFEGGNSDVNDKYTPYYLEQFKVLNSTATFTISDEVFEPISEKISLSEKITTQINVTTSFSKSIKGVFADVRFIPIRKNQFTNQYEVLKQFTLSVNYQSTAPENCKVVSALSYAANSILATGNWYKLAITTDGIYKLTYDDLRILGIDMTSLDPHNVRIYGNGGGLLPFKNTDYRPDDIQENAIEVIGEGDGKFDKEDYIIFYGKGPELWKLSNGDNRFHHQKNFNSDSAYYFLNVDLGPGKRIQSQASTNQTPTDIVTSFDDYQFYEKDRFNFIKSGREFFGNPFDVEPSQQFSFNFPNLDVSTPVYIFKDFAARTFVNNSTRFITNYNGVLNIDTVTAGAVCAIYTCDYCATNTRASTFLATTSTISLTINFQSFSSPSNGWLNYMELNVRRQLAMAGNEVYFRDKNSIGLSKVSQFNISSFSDANLRLWEITSPWNVKSQQYISANGTASFTLPTDSLRQFIAFNSAALKSPVINGAIENQDLHGLPQSDFIIVAHPRFIDDANRLADFHRNQDGLSVIVVTTTQVFNEFSSGAQDASAIRNFVKMFYDRATVPAELPRYLLLFGDGSYDNRNIVYNTGNFIVTYQSPNSCSLTGSYTSDDYFGLIEDGEGEWNSAEDVDIGIGRFPVSNETQAKIVVDKIVFYGTPPGKIIDESACTDNTCSPLGDWRNWITFLSDDEDGNLHMYQSERLAKPFLQKNPVYNQDKIYLDAFQQVSTPGGQRYPDAKDALNKRVAKGALIMNYTGHGGELGWCEERFLEVSDIRSWTNNCKLPLFITATCEFSRFDDPGRTSAGELVLINSAAGGIGLFTTTRLAFSNSNESINRALLDSLFALNSGNHVRLGDAFRGAKEKVKGDPNNRNVTFLGDPALKLAYPQMQVAATYINANAISTSSDTLEALSSVTIKGEVRDLGGIKLSNYNGIVYPSVFDKISTIKNLSNDVASPDTSFQLRKNVLYKGKVEVKNGDFEFTFIVPKDISYQYGFGRLSFYAQDGLTDANGNYDSIVIGGINPNAAADLKGPEIKLYLNNNRFVFGGLTDNSPSVYAEIADSNGINTVGNGIGHDLTAQLDNDNEKVYTLNDYFQNDLNSYKNGKVLYKLSELSAGNHTLKLKAWDIYNNSSESYTEFVVAESAILALENVMNYPNPFTTKTRFMFDLNRCCLQLAVEIRIYTISGKLVKSLNQYIQSDGFHVDNINWDGKDDYGDQLAKGTYIYKIKVRSFDGEAVEKIEKLVILK